MELQSAEIKEIAAALFEVQGTVGQPRKQSTNPFHESKYADIEAIWNEVKVPLQENNLLLVHSSTTIDGQPHLVCQITHVPSRQWFRGYFLLTPAKPGPQPFCAAITYMRRYSTASMIFMVMKDDDGETASGRGDYKEPIAKEPEKEYTRETPFWIVVKGYEKCHGQAWTELPDSLLQLMLDSETTDQTPVPYLKAIEVANDEIARRIEESGQ